MAPKKVQNWRPFSNFVSHATCLYCTNSTKCVVKHLTFSDRCVTSWQVHQLEFILDSLVDEKDRSTQKRGEATSGRAAGVGAGHGSANSASDGSSQLSLEISVSRPAEIEAALQQFVSPKVTFYIASKRHTRRIHCTLSLGYWRIV